MIKILPIAFVGALATSASNAKTFQNHHVVVLEDSGVVQDMTTDYENDAKDRPTFRIARMALLDKLDAELGRRDLVTIVSLAIPQVVWQGSANDMLDGDNYVLGNFLAGPFNGCANFDRLLKTISREIALADTPLRRIVFMSSMVSTGGNTRDPSTCKAPSLDDLAPPDTFFDGLVGLHQTSGASFEFYWVWDEVDDVVADYFMEAGVPFRIKGEQQTTVELSR